MKISCLDDNNDVLFMINDFPPEYKYILENSFYSLEGGSYVKRFPKNTPNIARISTNFERYAEEMFSQLCYFSKARWEEALINFINRLKGTGIDWWLTGSCATCIRGIAIEPHDIDIMLHSEDIEKINEIFADYIVEPIRSSKGWVVANFGVLFMNARIDLAFDPESFVDDPDPADFGPYAMQNLEKILWNGHTVKMPPLELQLNVNKRRGRDDRVKAIEGFLSNR